MKYYQELTIIPSADVSPFFVWSKCFTQVHLALVQQAKATYGENATMGDIGVSFPEYCCEQRDGKPFTRLGTKLRVFANTRSELEKLNLDKWCERLQDYIHIKRIAEVGDKATGHVLVKRFRQQKNHKKKTRKFASREKIDYEEAEAKSIAYIAKQKGISLEAAKQHFENPVLEQKPYIKIASLANKHKFSLEIDQQQVEQAQQGGKQGGKFSTYGFSAHTTVPHW